MTEHRVEYEIENLKSEIRYLRAEIITLKAQVEALRTNDIAMYDLNLLDPENCSCSCEVD